MYVCIEVALCGVSVETGIKLGLEEGPIKWVQCPVYHWSRVTHAGSHLRTTLRFCSQLYSRQLRVTRILIGM